MRATPLTAAIALAATGAQAADILTRGEIAELPFMTAFAYAEAIDAVCLPEWHYASTALAAAAIAQADLQDKSYVGAERTREASLLRGDRSACEPAKSFVDKVAATIPEMQPRMDATLAALEKEEAQRDAARARAEQIAQCGHVVAVVKAFLAARWSLADGGYEEELPRCIAELAAIPEAGDLLAEAKTLLPQMVARIKMQSGNDSVKQGDVDPQKIIADWCDKQRVKTALCDETPK
ncbi:MAG TPA: hypothetical protein VGX71_07615 [Pseudaminobacter sp.]|nr:hypothetical protein [Pseudaminobacter sp.]